MKQYIDLVNDIVTNGVMKEAAREGQSATLSRFGTTLRFDVAEEFPLLTTKRMFTRGVLVELYWFMTGNTNIRFLLEHNVHIWDDDAYRFYLERSKYHQLGQLTKTQFLSACTTDDQTEWGAYCPAFYTYGDCGPIYGEQWRDFSGVDQLKTLITQLTENRYGRYGILSAWNPKDITEMALPPCHLLYQFDVRRVDDVDVLNLQMYQRSADTALGVPFNIASCGFFLTFMAYLLGYEVGELIWVGGDTHIYEHHIEQLKKQIDQIPLQPCTYTIESDTKEDAYSFLTRLDSVGDDRVTVEEFVSLFKTTNYEHNGVWNYKLDTGLIE